MTLSPHQALKGVLLSAAALLLASRGGTAERTPGLR